MKKEATLPFSFLFDGALLFVCLCTSYILFSCSLSFIEKGWLAIYLSGIFTAARTDAQWGVVSVCSTLVPSAVLVAIAGALYGMPAFLMCTLRGAFVGIFLWLVLLIVGYFSGKKGYGTGDIDMCMLISIAQGYQGLYTILLIASVLALLFFIFSRYLYGHWSSREVYFCPFMAAAVLLTLFFPI